METQANEYINALNILVKPADADSTADLHETLERNLRLALDWVGVSDISSLETLRRVRCEVSEQSSVRWRFVCATLHILLSLKDDLAKDHLLSIGQQKCVKTCLQFVISMGLLPSLLPGVGISLASRCNSKLKDEDLVILEKYNRLASVTRALLVCCEHAALRTILLEQHLGDMMAALSQLSFVPLKKPTAKPQDNLMTPELWQKLQEDRAHFKTYYLSFVAQVYQPLVIKQLLILQGSPGSKLRPPGWLRRACVQLLVQCLMRRGGVGATVRAICQPDDLQAWDKLDTVVRLLTTTHSLQEDVYYQCIGQQMTEMLSLDDTPQNALLTRVAVLSIRALSEKKPIMCHRYVLNPMMSPLMSCKESSVPDITLATEEKFSQCIGNLSKCFADGVNGLSPELLWPVARVLFRLHLKIFRSACSLKTPVQQLLLRFMSDCPQDKLHQVLGGFLFDDVVTGMPAFSSQVELQFGPTGGVQVALCKQPTNQDTSDEAGICLMELLEKGGKVGDMFLFLLHVMCDPKPRDLQGTSKNLIAIKFLIILAENASVQERIRTEPGPIIRFIGFLLDREANRLSEKESQDDERLYTITMILGVLIASQPKDWTEYEPLKPALKVLADGLSEGETRDLASKLHNAIASHGVVNQATPSTRRAKRKGKSACKEALAGVEDASIPVRGHALITLARLVDTGDPEAKRNRERILSVFQENLKHEDSYIYLSCVNGLGVMATAGCGNTVVQTLVEELATQRAREDATELAMKIAEVLVRITKQLGDLVPTYKAMLLNVFLSGTRDSDPLVRASSLSSLGQVCQALGFRVGSVCGEILLCVQSLVQSDESVVVRRAAILLVTLLLQGLGQDALKVLAEVMLSLYRTLKTVRQAETDDVVKLHCQLALEELNKSTFAYLFPPRKLEKQLFVLTPPPPQ